MADTWFYFYDLSCYKESVCTEKNVGLEVKQMKMVHFLK